MPINFDLKAVEELEKEFLSFTEQRKAKIDAMAAQIFVQLHMVGLAHNDLPSTVPELQRKETAKLRLLAMTLEAVYGMTAKY